MRNQRPRPAPIEGGSPGRFHINDFISRMHDDLLLMILCLLPIKEAVATSSLSKRWRFVWCKLIKLNFDASESSQKMFKDWKLCVQERAKYVKMVKNVIKSHSHLKVQELRIRFDLDRSYYEDINDWVRFAVDKRVEIFELDLMDNGHKHCHPDRGYKFPYRLYDRDMKHCSGIVAVEMLYLKKLYLKKVNVSEAILRKFLTNSPNLETLSIHYSSHLTDNIFVGGRALNLKHFEIAYCIMIEYINLYDFDLVSFTYKGQPIQLRLTGLPELKELDIGGVTWLGNDVLSQISSCLSFLQVLSFNIDHPKKSLKLDAIPELPNVKRLRLTIGARKDDSLLEFTNLAKACPSLESFTVELLWVSPMKRRRKVRHVAGQPNERLNILEILGYYGRTTDLELVAYFIDNAAGLKKIVIDSRPQVRKGTKNLKDFSTTEESAGSSAKTQLESIKPQGVELIFV